jgi:hypothetical protein
MLYAMTPIQEIFNAITMIFPTIVLLWNVWNLSNQLTIILLIGSSMHLPVSFTYHLSVAFNRYSDRIDNDMRRLDQSMQHIIGILYSFALSGSFLYTVLNIFYNIYGIIYLWNPKTSNDGKRWIPVTISIFLYTLPMLWRGDINNYILVITSIFIGGLCFIPQLNYNIFMGWGHTLFHIMLIYYAQILVNSTNKINSKKIEFFIY